MFLSKIAPSTIPDPAKKFLLGVVLNGIGNGIFGVVFQLYFSSIGIGSSTLGSIIMMNALSAAILTIPMGVLADKYGKKNVMYLLILSMLVSAPLLLFTKSISMFKLAFLSIGVGNAAAVILSPIYSSYFEKDEMDKAFGLFGALNIVTISFGSLLGFIPPFLVDVYGFTFQTAYWSFMALGALFFIFQNMFYLWALRDYQETKSTNGFKINIESRDLVIKITLIQALSATSIGVFFSLFPFYVNKKFGLESDALGALFFASNLLSAMAQAISPRLSARLGSLRTIAISFGLAAPFYLLISFASSFKLLSLLYLMRFSLATMAAPLMSSILMRDLKDEEKATANSFKMMAMQGGGVIGPWIGGILMERASLELPALVGGCLYAIMAALTIIMTWMKRPDRMLVPVLPLENPSDDDVLGDTNPMLQSEL